MTDLQAPQGLNQNRPHPKSALPLIWTVGAVFLFGLFVFLGSWQVQRLIWKLDLIERVNARVHAAPQVLPGPGQWPAMQGKGAKSTEYLRVSVSGEFDHQRQALVQASTELGAGYWVLTPMRTEQGWWVWVNRGFVQPAREQKSQPLQPTGTVALTGLLRVTEPKGGFLRDNDPQADRWHSRDVTALSERHLAGETVAPYFIDQASDADTPAGQLPVTGLTVIQFKNNHFVYLITWYVLAAMVAGAWVFMRRHARQPHTPDPED